MLDTMHLALVDPMGLLESGTHGLLERRRNEAGPVVVVFIVAVAVLLAISAVMSIATMIYCIGKGGNFAWSSSNGWKFWEMKVACRFS